MSKKEKKTTIQVMLKGEKIEAQVRPIPIKNLFFDESNPRISMFKDSWGPENLNQDKIMYSLQLSPSYLDLKNSITGNNGVLYPLWVYPLGDNKYCVIEGNTRLAVYRDLNDEHPNDPNYKCVNCTVLDDKIDEEHKDFIRLTAHLHGQTPWDTYERAKYLFILYYKRRYPMKDLVQRTKLSRKEILEDIEAYQIMNDEFSKVVPTDNRAFVHKFSYFKEYAKNKKLKATMEEHKFGEDDFSKWVADEKLNEARDVRKLASILGTKESREIFIKKDFDRAIDILKDVIPEKADKIYQNIYELTKQLRKMSVYQIKNMDAHKREILGDLKSVLDDIVNWGK